MDVPQLLVRARTRAEMTRDQLAAAAATSRSALSAYERGRTSPTVATLDRLLAACGVQIRAELEPYLADVDAAVDALLAGSPDLPVDLDRIAAALDAAGIGWAFDGSTALALHGLAAERGVHAELVAVGSAELRRFLYDLGGVGIVDRDGEPIWNSWLSADLDRVGTCRAFTRFGGIALRVVAELPPAVRVEAGGHVVPVLPLLEVERAHPGLAVVLARLRERRTV